jgi:hypothetical protein
MRFIEGKDETKQNIQIFNIDLSAINKSKTKNENKIYLITYSFTLQRSQNTHFLIERSDV